MSGRTRRSYLRGAGVVALGGLAGCSGESNGSNQAGGAATSGESAGTTTISWWHAMGGNLGETVDALAEQFNEQSDSITVETTYQGGYFETLNNLFAAKETDTLPTVAQVVDTGMARAVDGDVIKPVEQVVEDGIVWDDFHDPVRSYYTYDGQIQLLPFNSSNPITYYNKTLFEEAGIDPGEFERPTFRDYIDVMKRLESADVVEYPGSFVFTNWFIEQWFTLDNQPLLNNGNGREDDPTELLLDTETGTTIAEWALELTAEGNTFYDFPGSASGPGWDAANQRFNSQESAINIGSTAGAASNTAAAEEAGFELGTAFMPAPEGNRAGLWVSGGSVGVCQDQTTEKERAATEFLSWLAEPEQQAFWHRNTGYFPVSGSAVSLLRDQDWFEENPNFETAFDQLQEFEETPATRGFQCGPATEVRNLVQESYETMITDSRDAEAELQAGAQQGSEILQEYIDSKG